MAFTRLLQIAGYLFGALFLFGVVTQIVQVGRPASQEHREAVETWRKAFATALQQSHVSQEQSAGLRSVYDQLIEEREHSLQLASMSMAMACTVVVGLLSVIAFLWRRVRVQQHKA